MPASIRWPLAAAVLLGLLAGCASLDPRDDIAQSARIVEDRTGLAVGWPEPAASGPDAVWDGKSPLTARQAAARAIADNPAIGADLAVIAAARADLAQAGLLPNPVLNVSLGWGVSGGSSMLTAGAMQSLSSLWLRPSRQAAAHAELQRTILRVSDNAITLAARVEASHRRIVHYQTLLAVLEEQREVLSRAEAASRAGLAAGLGTSLDVNRFRAERLEVDAGIRDVWKDMDLEKRALLESMNRADASADWSAAAASVSADAVPDEEGLVALARRQRLDLQAASWSVQAQQARLREAQLEALPETDAGADLERDSPSGEKAMTTLGPSLRVEAPIFDQGQARVTKARSELDRLVMEARSADQNAVLQVRLARRTLHSAEEQAHAYRTEVVPLATQNIRQAQAAFEAGDANVLDVLMAERDWAKARIALQQFDLERDLALIALTRAVGGRLVYERAQEP